MKLAAAERDNRGQAESTSRPVTKTHPRIPGSNRSRGSRVVADDDVSKLHRHEIAHPEGGVKGFSCATFV